MDKISHIQQLCITVRKAKHVAGPKHVGDGKFPIYVVGGFFRSFYVDDGIFHHQHVWSCVMLAFFNSACSFQYLTYRKTS
jgi:hypothetical protein